MVKMADPRIFKTFQGNGNERYEYFCLPWPRGWDIGDEHSSGLVASWDFWATYKFGYVKERSLSQSFLKLHISCSIWLHLVIQQFLLEKRFFIECKLHCGSEQNCAYPLAAYRNPWVGSGRGEMWSYMWQRWHRREMLLLRIKKVVTEYNNEIGSGLFFNRFPTH